jgi:hypothetical protein
MIALTGAAPASGEPRELASVEVPEGWSPPKTPWGHPDLQGNLTNLHEVGVPLERPEEFAGREWGSFTRAELAEIRKRQEEQYREREVNRTDVRGGTPEIILDAFQHERGSVLWFVTDPSEGQVPPLTSAGKARAERAQALRDLLREGETVEDSSLFTRCISRGLPNSMMPAVYGNSYQIVQAPGYVAIRYEMVNETRIIPLDGRPRLPEVHNTWMGDARGYFEGDTLVVETTNFPPERTPRDASPGIRLIEKFTRIGPDKILWSTTFDDPETWTRAWTHTVPLTIDDTQPIVEYACHEGNYGLWNIFTARRHAEQQAGEGAN